jgi:hypothetical protein
MATMAAMATMLMAAGESRDGSVSRYDHPRPSNYPAALQPPCHCQ